MPDVRVQVWGVGRNSDSQYLLVLRDESQRILPMVIGPCEALSIWSALRADESQQVLGRPMTHDLLQTLIERLGGRLVKVVIDDLWNKVFYAKLHIALNGEVVTVDSRPSDAVAIALRMGAPLFASISVMDAANQPDEPGEPPPEFDAGDLGDL
jgi:hypothetical protein